MNPHIYLQIDSVDIGVYRTVEEAVEASGRHMLDTDNLPIERIVIQCC